MVDIATRIVDEGWITTRIVHEDGMILAIQCEVVFLAFAWDTVIESPDDFEHQPVPTGEVRVKPVEVDTS